MESRLGNRAGRVRIGRVEVDECVVFAPKPSPPHALTTSVLFEVILSLEALPAHLAAEGELGTLVGAFVDHEVVALGEAALAVLADELALGTHLATELPTAHIVIDLHYREHLAAQSIYSAC